MSTIMVNGIEVPEPMREAPKKEEILWRVDIDNFNGVDQIVWFASEWQRWMLKNGLCHLTESAARQHFDALIAPSRADAQKPNPVESHQVKEPEWIKWNGGACPIPFETVCEVKFRNGETYKKQARDFSWIHGYNREWEIIAYRACITWQKPVQREPSGYAYIYKGGTFRFVPKELEVPITDLVQRVPYWLGEPPPYS